MGTFSHLHGRRDSCVRHGRKAALLGDAKDIYKQVHGGRHIPAGLEQVKVTSPYTARNLTRYSECKKTDACPDCLTELG